MKYNEDMRMRWLAVWCALTVGFAVIAPSPAVATAGRTARPMAATADERRDPALASQPVAVAPVSGDVVRQFEQPPSRYGPGHRGVDLAVTPGEPVAAAMAGTVRFAGSVAGETWVTVAHARGIETTYGGLHASVAVGQRVEMGQRLGEMRPGRQVLDWGARISGGPAVTHDYVDPLGLLAGWRVRLVAVEAR